MNKEFVPYKQALALKELGFDEPCFGLYHNDKTFYPTQCKSQEQFHGQVCSAPLYQQAFRWFREKHSLGHMINGIGYEAFCIGVGGAVAIFSPFEFNTYEEAEDACLDKLIELVKTNTAEIK